VLSELRTKSSRNGLRHIPLLILEEVITSKNKSMWGEAVASLKSGTTEIFIKKANKE